MEYSLIQQLSLHQEQCSPVTIPPLHTSLQQPQQQPSVAPHPRNSKKNSSPFNINDHPPPKGSIHHLLDQDYVVAHHPCRNAPFVLKPLKIMRENEQQV